MDETTLNIFHNPFDGTGCLEMSLLCMNDYESNLAMRSICHRRVSSVELPDQDVDAYICMAATYDTWYKQEDQIISFGIGIDEFCPTELVEFATYTFREDEFVAIVGCRNLTDNLTHEEGAWILVPTVNATEMAAEFLEGLIDTVMERVPAPLSAAKNNFVVVDFQQGKLWSLCF